MTSALVLSPQVKEDKTAIPDVFSPRWGQFHEAVGILVIILWVSCSLYPHSTSLLSLAESVVSQPKKGRDSVSFISRFTPVLFTAYTCAKPPSTNNSVPVM